MSEWPRYVHAAAYDMGYDYNEPEGRGTIVAFAARYGGFDPESLSRAVRTGEGDDWLFAILLLIHSGIPEARDVVVPLLASTNRLMRSYGALYLGTLRDRRALPVLQEMLTESLPAPEAYRDVRLKQSRYEDARASAAYLLGMTGEPSSAPALRAALQKVIYIEQLLVSSPVVAPESERWDYDNALRDLRSYQDTLVYALGQLGAFGALLGLHASSEDGLSLWRIHMVMGHLHGEYRVADLIRFEDEPALLADVSNLLERTFGLTSSEQVRHLALYEMVQLPALSSLYSAEEMERARHMTTEVTSDQ